jgi:hypothetical protein
MRKATQIESLHLYRFHVLPPSFTCWRRSSQFGQILWGSAHYSLSSWGSGT